MSAVALTGKRSSHACLGCGRPFWDGQQIQTPAEPVPGHTDGFPGFFTAADVFTCFLFEHVEAVVLGDDGVFAHVAPGTLVIDMSTIRPDVARQLAEAGAAREIRVLDAPVSGGEQGTVDAKLSIMVGGDAGAFEAAKPVLDAMGTTVVHVGPAGAGQTVKAANQLIVAGVLELVSESLVFLDAHGVDLERAVQVLAGGLAGNAVLDRKAAGMLARNFSPGFRVDLHHKDLGIVTSAAPRSRGSHTAGCACRQPHGCGAGARSRLPGPLGPPAPGRTALRTQWPIVLTPARRPALADLDRARIIRPSSYRRTRSTS